MHRERDIIDDLSGVQCHHHYRVNLQEGRIYHT
jgi:hypothetical protein